MTPWFLWFPSFSIHQCSCQMSFSGSLQLHGLICRRALYLQLMTTGGRVCKDNAAVTLVLGSLSSCSSQTQHQMVLFSFLWAVAKPVMLCCSCWTCPAQLRASGYSVLSALLEKQRCCGRSIIWLSWQVPSHFCEGHIPAYHPSTSSSLDSWSQSEAFIGVPNLSWKIAWIAAMYFCFAVCFETVGVFLLTFTKNIYLEVHPGV